MSEEFNICPYCKVNKKLKRSKCCRQCYGKNPRGSLSRRRGRRK